MTAWVRFLTLPPLPEVPEPLRANPIVDVTAAFAGPAAEGAELIRPLMELGDPIDEHASGRSRPALSALNGDPPRNRCPASATATCSASFPPRRAGRPWTWRAPGSGSPLLSVQLRQLGGALAAPAGGRRRNGGLDAAFAVNAVGLADGSRDGTRPPTSRWER